MTVLFVVLAIAVVTGISLLAVGRLGGLPDAPPDRVPDDLPAEIPIKGQHLQQVRFDVAARGYRMDEVDGLLDRLASEIAVRDATIASLRDELGLRDPSIFDSTVAFDSTVVDPMTTPTIEQKP